MAKVIMRAQGTDGMIELLTDRVVINRNGLWNALKYGSNAKREIPLGAISEVMFKGASGLRFGEIEFVRGGRSATEKKNANETIVKFKKAQSDTFEQLKEKCFELMQNVARHQ